MRPPFIRWVCRLIRSVARGVGRRRNVGGPPKGQDSPPPTCRGAMNNHRLKVFSGRANIPLADKIARYLGDVPGKILLSNFPDGEISVRIEEDVRGGDVFLVQ